MRSVVGGSVLVFGVLVALGACADEPGGEPGEAAAPVVEVEAPEALTRLWLRDPVEHRRPTGSGGGSLRFEALFDGALTFYQACTPEAEDGVDPTDAALSFEAVRPHKGVLPLPYKPDCYGLVAAVPVRPGEALSLTVAGRDVRANQYRKLETGQITTEDDELDVVFVTELKERFDPERVWSLDEITALRDPRRHAHRVLEIDPADQDGFETTARFVTDRSTHTLWVQLLGPNVKRAPPRVFTRLEVRRHDLTDHLASGGELPGVRALEPLPGDDRQPIDGAVLAQLDRDERAALLALPGTRRRWSLPGHDAERSLDLSLGLFPRDASFEGAARFLVRARAAGADEWTVLLDETLRAPVSAADAAWHDRVLAVPALAPEGARLELELATEGVGPEPPVAVFGHPSLHTPVGRVGPNVVLISLDTLRPDRLGCYGGDASLSPNLDALAAEGLRWERAWSTSSYTLPSHASMMTGQFPAFHGAVNIDDVIQADKSPLLAALLARAGWATAAFTGGGYVGTSFGFGVGFDRYSTNDPVWAYDALRGEMLLQTMSWEREPLDMDLLRRYDAGSIERWIAGRAGQDTPFFLFLHTYIVHNYAPSREWLERMGLVDEGAPMPERAFDHKPRTAFNEGQHELLDQVYDAYMPYYDGTIGMADAFVGRVLGALEAAGVDEDTLVIVTSDHGEEFGEHGFFGHGETLHEANTRIPFLARLPGPREQRVGRVLDDAISLADIAPWVLRVAGLEPADGMVIAPPLAPRRADPPGRDMLFIELDNVATRRSAVVDGDHKLMVHLEEQREPLEVERRRFYDLGVDPDEQDDLVADGRADQAEVDRLRGRLEQFHGLAAGVMPRDGGATDYSGMTLEQLQQLVALGYITVDDLDEILKRIEQQGD